MIVSTITGNDNITLDIVKNHLNVTFSDDDDYLKSLIDVSLSAVENYCRNTFIAREKTENIGAFDTGLIPRDLMTGITYTPNDENITIEYTQTTVKTIDVPVRNLYTLDKSHYVYVNNHIYIYLKEDIAVDIGTDVTLKWTTGQNDEMDLSIKQARLLLIGTYYENRESVAVGVAINELPNGVAYLLEAYLAPQVG